MTLEEILNGFRQGILDRLTSPFWISFSTSWSVINYEVYLILFSNNTVTTTIQLMNSVAFPTTWSLVIDGLVFPATIGLSYIYLYPHPARCFYEYTLKQQLKLNRLRQDLEDATVLTVEQSRELKAYIAEQKVKYQTEIDRLESENEALVKKYSANSENKEAIESSTTTSNDVDRNKYSLSELEFRILDSLAEISDVTKDEETVTEKVLRNYITDVSQIDFAHAIGSLIKKELLSNTPYFRRKELKVTQLGRETYIWNRDQIKKDWS